MNKIVLTGGIATGIALVAALAYAQAAVGGGASPRLLPYVGHLDHDGSPVTGQVAMKVCLVNKADTDCSDKVWTEEFDSVAVAGGNFSLVLGQKTAIPDSIYGAAGGLFIRAMVGATVASGTPTFVQLSGAQQVLSVPFAINANQAADLRVEGPLHTGPDVPSNKVLGLYQETPSAPIHINTNGGPVSFSLDANSGNGYSPGDAMLSVLGNGVQIGSSHPIRQITNCYHSGTDQPGPSKAYEWAPGTADCDNGPPTGSCYGVLNRGNECGEGACNWTVLSPGQDGRALTRGGMVWYHNNGCGAGTQFEVGALYFCWY